MSRYFQVFLFLALFYVYISAESKPEETVKGSKDCCMLAEKSGPCLAYIPRYRYDPSSKTCKKFIYGGCRGNCNRFLTDEACISACREKNFSLNIEPHI